MGKRARKDLGLDDKFPDPKARVFTDASHKSTRMAVVSIAAAMSGLKLHKLLARLGQSF